MIRMLGTGLAGLLGLAFGSFLNVCLSRWPGGESVVKPRSHCRSCGRTLAWWENIPVVSWMALRGRCRTCDGKISWRYPLVELAVGMLWGLESWIVLAGANASLPVSIICYQISVAVGLMAFLWLLVALAVLDAEHLWLPDRLVLPAIAAGILTSFGWLAIVTDLNKEHMDDVSLSALPITLSMAWVDESWRMLSALNSHEFVDDVLSFVGAPIIGAALILLIRWSYWLIRRREGIGLGDAKLMAMLGAWLGLSGALLSFAIGVFLGAVFALIVLAVPSGRRGSERWLTARLPLGTFLCIGGIISALWGQPIIAAYLHWAGF